MLNVSQDFKDFAKYHKRQLDVQLLINDVEIDDIGVVSFEIEDSMGLENDISIGTFVAKMLKLKLKREVLESQIVVGDKIKLNIRFKKQYDVDMTFENQEFSWNELTQSWFNPTLDVWSEFVSMGTFYVDSTPILKNDILTVQCFDSTIFSDVFYETNDTFPLSMQTVFDNVNAIVGYDLDSSVVINPSHLVSYYNNTEPMTIREIIANIAGCQGANARINVDGKLVFQTLTPSTSVETMSLGTISEYKHLNPIRKITNLIAKNDSETFTVGSGNKSETLLFNNKFVTSDILSDIYSVVNGFEYLPIEIDNIGLPYLEIGDKITVEQMNPRTWLNTSITWDTLDEIWDYQPIIETVITKFKWSFNGGLKNVIQNDGISEQQNEYNIEGELTRKTNNLNNTAVKTTDKYYGVRINRDNGLEIERTDLSARIIFNADEFRMQVGDGAGNYTDSLYFDPVNHQYVFVGEVTVTAEDVVGLGDLATKDTVGSSEIDTNAITETKISGNAVTTPKIATNAVTANEISVSSLSAISANIGSVTSGTITGALIRTASSGKRLQISDDDLNTYNASNQKHGIQIEASKNFNALDFYDDNVLTSTLQLVGNSFSLASLLGSLTLASKNNIVIGSDDGSITISADGSKDVNLNGNDIKINGASISQYDVIAGNGLDVTHSVSGATVDIDPSETCGDGLQEDGSQNFEVDDTVARTGGQPITFQYFSDHLEVKLGSGSYKVINFD